MLVRYDNISLAYRRLGRLLWMISFVALGVAAYLQYAWSLNPCSLCIAQRYAFFFIGLSGILLCAAGSKFRSFAIGMAALAALCGLAVAARNLWVQRFPSPSCGIDALSAFLNNLPWVSLWPTMFEATGLCSDVIPNVLGVSFPGWALLGFLVVLGLITVRLVAKRRRSVRHPLPLVPSNNPW